MAENDFDEIAKRIKEKRQADALAQQYSLKRDAFIRANAPLFWNRVKEAVKSEVVEFNAAMAENDMFYDDSDPYRVQIRTTQNGASQFINFDQTRWQIQVYGLNNDAPAKTFSVDVKDDGCATQLLFKDEIGIPRSPEEIAKPAVLEFTKVIR